MFQQVKFMVKFYKDLLVPVWEWVFIGSGFSGLVGRESLGNFLSGFYFLGFFFSFR